MAWLIVIGISFFFSLVEVTTGHAAEALYFLLLSIGMIEVMKFLLTIDIRKAITIRDKKEDQVIKATAKMIGDIGRELEKKQKESSVDG